MSDLSPEMQFATSRSGGKGGQNVNKVETAVAASWSLANTKLLTAEEQVRVRKKLAHRLDKRDVLTIRATDKRSQLENKELAIQRLQALVDAALVPDKKRRATKPSRAAIVARLENKARNAAKKQDRRQYWD